MNDELFKNFCKDRNLSSGSVKVYEHAIRKYVEYNGMTLTELIDEADNEEEEGIRWKRRKLKRRLIGFRSFLIENKFAKETINTMMKRVTTFYRHYEIEIHHLPRVNIQSTVEIKIPTREDLQQAVEASKPLMKAIILFLSSSGMSKVDCLNLTINDFIEATREYHHTHNINEALLKLNERDDIIPTFSLTRQKTKKFHYTFCSPEATTSILNYLNSRTDNLTPTSSLFKISPIWLSVNFENLNEQLELGVTKGNHYGVLRCHTLRKYHATTLRDDGLSIDIINSFQGKAKNRVDSAYFIDTPDKLKEMYTEHVNSLYILDTRKYKTELETVKEENIELKEKQNELNDLWEEIKLVKEKQKEWDKIKEEKLKN